MPTTPQTTDKRVSRRFPNAKPHERTKSAVPRCSQKHGGVGRPTQTQLTRREVIEFSQDECCADASVSELVSTLRWRVLALFGGQTRGLKRQQSPCWKRACVGAKRLSTGSATSGKAPRTRCVPSCSQLDGTEGISDANALKAVHARRSLDLATPDGSLLATRFARVYL